MAGGAGKRRPAPLVFFFADLSRPFGLGVRSVHWWTKAVIGAMACTSLLVAGGDALARTQGPDQVAAAGTTSAAEWIKITSPMAMRAVDSDKPTIVAAFRVAASISEDSFALYVDGRKVRASVTAGEGSAIITPLDAVKDGLHVFAVTLTLPDGRVLRGERSFGIRNLDPPTSARLQIDGSSETKLQFSPGAAKVAETLGLAADWEDGDLRITGHGVMEWGGDSGLPLGTVGGRLLALKEYFAAGSWHDYRLEGGLLKSPATMILLSNERDARGIHLQKGDVRQAYALQDKDRTFAAVAETRLGPVTGGGVLAKPEGKDVYGAVGVLGSFAGSALKVEGALSGGSGGVGGYAVRAEGSASAGKVATLSGSALHVSSGFQSFNTSLRRDVLAWNLRSATVVGPPVAFEIQETRILSELDTTRRLSLTWTPKVWGAYGTLGADWSKRWSASSTTDSKTVEARLTGSESVVGLPVSFDGGASASVAGGSTLATVYKQKVSLTLSTAVGDGGVKLDSEYKHESISIGGLNTAARVTLTGDYTIRPVNAKLSAGYTWKRLTAEGGQGPGVFYFPRESFAKLELPLSATDLIEVEWKGGTDVTGENFDTRAMLTWKRAF